MKLGVGFMLVTLVAASYAAPKQLQEPVHPLLRQLYPSVTFVLGGEKAEKHTHTYMVALSYGFLIKDFLIRGFLCGGSLISQRTVLTAAHCVHDAYRDGGLIRSLRGTVGTLRWNEGGTMYSFSRNVTHPHYVNSTIKNDLSLLITKTFVLLSATVSILPINFDFQGADVPVTVAGWGATGFDEAESDDLLVVNLKIVDGNRCVKEVKAASHALGAKEAHIEPDIELCAFHEPGRGVCNSDSGSPLVRIEDGQQVGLVSWGFPCARGVPDVFVRLSAYKEWIQQNMV